MSHTTDAPGPVAHVRHRPEQPLLYQLVERHYPAFARLMAEQGSPLLVDEVLPKVPLRQWVLSMPFPLRFLFASYNLPDAPIRRLTILHAPDSR